MELKNMSIRNLEILPVTNNSIIVRVEGTEFKIIAEENGNFYVYFPDVFKPEIKHSSIKFRKDGNK